MFATFGSQVLSQFDQFRIGQVLPNPNKQAKRRSLLISNRFYLL
jgi:hypothetical protein